MNRKELEALLPKGYKLVSPETGNRATPLTVTCDKGHVWERARIGNIEKNGTRCPKCNQAHRYRLTIEEVRFRVGENGWELLTEEYRSAHQKLHIRCKACGNERYAQLTNIYNRCQQCRKLERQKDAMAALDQILSDKNYELLDREHIEKLTQSRLSVSSLELKCSEGHVWKNQFKNVVYRDQNCGTCENTKPLTIEEIRGRLDEDYELITETYINNRQKLVMKHLDHFYETTWQNYQRGHRCTICFSTRSAAEGEISKILQELGFKPIENTRELLSSRREIDLYIPEKKLAIEYCGLFYHNEDSKERDYHARKYLDLKNMGIQLITIFEDEWLRKKEIVKSILASKLGKFKQIVQARKCEVRDVNKEEFRSFFKENHIQGAPATTTSNCYGLYFDGALMQAMSFGKGHRQNSGNDLVIDRVCTRMGYQVIGGANRLLKVVKERAILAGATQLRSFSDRRYSNGAVYEKLEFRHEKVWPPDYSYVKGAKRQSKQSLKLTKQEKSENKTEAQLRREQGWVRIWDCGKDVWVKELI